MNIKLNNIAEKITKLASKIKESFQVKIDPSQLNLVLMNGSRESVVSYSKLSKAIMDSKNLSSEIGVDLWNAIPE